METPDQLRQLLEKLEEILKRQEVFVQEINQQRIEIKQLRAQALQMERPNSLQTSTKPVVENNEIIKEGIKIAQRHREEIHIKTEIQPNLPKKPIIKLDIEKFIGENLISKIGIGITVIGVAIGAKYSIDHNLINPLTRIILGYLMGIGLLGFGIKLKARYQDYSAVLVSGAMAILYFITFAAYSFYAIMPQLLAFGLMVIFTAFTVVAAIQYNKQVIAHIGLVGAYAVPFLLSDGSGRIAFLFGYIAIINTGILVIAFRKYWKSLYYAAFLLTWVIYSFWYANSYELRHFNLAFTFLVIYFVTFYATFLAYKLFRKEQFLFGDIGLLLANAFLFFGLGYSLCEGHPTAQHLLGVFTICNALIHFIISVVIYKQKLGDRNLLYLVSGLVLVFITIAIPVQLDGNWVTLLWVGEAALLFWIGRTKQVGVYEKLSYPLIILAFLSLLQDWFTVYYSTFSKIAGSLPLINTDFMSSLLFIGAFAFMNIINQRKNTPGDAILKKSFFKPLLNILLPGILLFTIYYAFRLEIVRYCSDQNNFKKVDFNYGEMLKSIWIINYSMVFVSLLSFVNIRKIKNQKLAIINLGLNTIAIGVFLTQGLSTFGEMREYQLELNHHSNVIGLRYVSFALVALTLLATYTYIKHFIKRDLTIAFDLLLHVSILWIASSELVNWITIVKPGQSYKLALSILWGIYALMVTALGIWKKKKHLRIGAIGLLGVTLIKLFFYDLSELDTISKTIVFVSLGILLLIISFLYNKYTHIIANEIKK